MQIQTDTYKYKLNIYRYVQIKCDTVTDHPWFLPEGSECMFCSPCGQDEQQRTAEFCTPHQATFSSVPAPYGSDGFAATCACRRMEATSTEQSSQERHPGWRLCLCPDAATQTECHTARRFRIFLARPIATSVKNSIL
jgi:hypothetical protein